MHQQPSRAISVWPGLPGLWHGGRAGSLAAAAAFALLLNLALASSFLWPDLPGQPFSLALWPILLVWSGVSYRCSRRVNGDSLPSDTAVSDDTLFIAAQTEYLKGNRDAARRLLTRRLTDNPRDLESRLLYATLLRRDGQVDEAHHQLLNMQRIDGWQTWHSEISRELALLGGSGDELHEAEQSGMERQSDSENSEYQNN